MRYNTNAINAKINAKRRSTYGDKYLSKVVSYTDDIKPHRLIELFSGVGSGKNYFINSLIKGYQEQRPDGTEVSVDPLVVLVITSRRSKVNELLTDNDLPADGKVGKWDYFHQVFDEDFQQVEETGKYFTLEDEWGTHNVFQRSVVCTNAFIERYLQYRYHPQDITTHLWELFDLIVIDEAHSLVTDASYQSSPFYVNELIWEFERRHKLAEALPEKHKPPRCGNLLLMTGSVAPMQKLMLPEKPHVINCMETCKNVRPENIHFLTREQAVGQVVEQLGAGDKVVYFTNHTPNPKEFIADTAIDPASVAISFSKAESRTNLEKDAPAEFQRMVRVETTIAESHRIPDDIHFWLTTSRNKEGINILNEDIAHLYVESHGQSDIIQMAGRIRCGVKHMYVVVDSKDNFTPEWKNEADFCNQQLATSINASGSIFDACNEYLDALCLENKIVGLFNTRAAQVTAYGKKNGCKPVAEYIDYIHDRFPYVRYSYVDNVFRFYQMRKESRTVQGKEIHLFTQRIEKPGSIEKMFRAWFPTSTVHPYVSEEEKQKREALEYLSQMGINDEGRRFTAQECDAMQIELNRIFGEDLDSLNCLLKKCMPFKLKRMSRAKSNPDYSLYKLYPMEEAG